MWSRAFLLLNDNIYNKNELGYQRSYIQYSTKESILFYASTVFPQGN